VEYKLGKITLLGGVQTLKNIPPWWSTNSEKYPSLVEYKL
jgi:hypothetical protein